MQRCANVDTMNQGYIKGIVIYARNTALYVISIHYVLLLSGHYLDTIWTLSGHYLDTIWTLSGHYLDTIWTLSGHPIALVTLLVHRPRKELKEIKANARESKIASGALPWPKIGTTLFPSAWSRPRRLTCRQPHGSPQRPRWGRQPGPL